MKNPHLDSIIAVRKYIRKHADPHDAKFLQRFFKTGPGEYAEGDKFLGIRVPVIRGILPGFIHLPETLNKTLLKSDYHEERLLALLIYVKKFNLGNDSQRKKIYKTYLSHTRFINNWDLIDLTAEHIVGAYLYDKHRAPLYRLARSPMLWEKRIAVMSTFHFIKNYDFEETLKLVKLLIGDEHHLIHKAAGWMLREIGKRNFKTEDAFLRENYPVMPRTMLSYAIEKYPEQIRIKYLRGEI